MGTARGHALIVFLLLIVALAAVGALLSLAPWKVVEPLSGSMILEVDLTRGYPEHLPDDPISTALFDTGPDLRGLVEAIERAAADDDVAALVGRVGVFPGGLATLQEVRDAVAAFRATGKPTVAWADTFGEWQPGNGAYYLASAFEEIGLQPSGDVGLTGLRYEVMFLRGALEKLGLEPDMDQRYEYKNALNEYTERGFTEAHREATEHLLEAQYAQLVEGIAAGRGMDPGAVRGLCDAGPYFGAEAVAAGLVDRLEYRDEVIARLRSELGEDTPVRPLERYARRGGSGGGRTVALVYGVGTVLRGESGFDPLSGTTTMGSETVAGALRAAYEDDDVEAILLRVNSPGGSYVASDAIWRETARERDPRKPLVVSMGDLAASGGYFVSMAADRIVAQPGTLTGSIGVYGGKFVTTGLWDKLGIGWGTVASGPRAGIWSSLEPFEEGQRERFQASLDRIYDDFTAKVASGRDLDPARVAEIARGRVWTGRDAVGLGLVDTLGGYPAARAAIRELLGLDAGARLRLKVFPRPKSPLELLREHGRWTARVGAALAALHRAVEPAIELARRLGVSGPPAPLRAPLAPPAP